MENEVVLFTDGKISIEVQVSPDQETVWLTQKQMGELFGVKQATLSEHINNILESGELDETSINIHGDLDTAQLAEQEHKADQTIRNMLAKTRRVLESRTTPFFREEKRHMY